MKAMAKLLAEFVAWRWAPAVGLLAASMVYVIVVVGVVPSEIGIPVANAKFSGKSLARPTATAAHANAANDAPAAPPPATRNAHASAEFGRRGFSPRLDRPEPPPPPPQAPPQPVVPPPAPPVATSQGPMSNIFSRIQGALRPGAAAAAAAAASAHQLAAAQGVAPPAPADPAAQNTPPAAPGAAPSAEAPAAEGATPAAPETPATPD
jgi:hypothetical protein